MYLSYTVRLLKLVSTSVYVVQHNVNLVIVDMGLYLKIINGSCKCTWSKTNGLRNINLYYSIMGTFTDHKLICCKKS